MTQDVDFVIIGAGIAGASAGYFLARDAKVVLLERESQPGYHTTGRSAALFAESYGTAQVRALTLASRAFFEHPPDGFCDGPILEPRAVVFIGTRDQADLLDDMHRMIAGFTSQVARFDAAETLRRIPVLRPAFADGAVLDGGAADMDVHALHHGFLRGIRACGGVVRCDADVTALTRDRGHWRVEAGGATWTAPVVINAAGAWADRVAALAGIAAIGLVPKRRTAFTFPAPAGHETAHWPCVIAVDESFYFKPDAGQMLGSPANADPVDPHDVRPEEEDVATGIWRIEEATTLQIRRPSHTWAGLRSFVADGDLVAGFDPGADGFFWCAAQGGYGIQTSAAMGEACAALARGDDLPAHIAAFGLTAAMLSPTRLSHPGPGHG